MTIKESLKKYGTRKLTRRLTRSLPWIGGVIAIATLGGAIKRKGLFGGLTHTALDAIPYFGGAKNIVEAVRGRDFIRDKADRTLAAQTTSIPRPTSPRPTEIPGPMRMASTRKA